MRRLIAFAIALIALLAVGITRPLAATIDDSVIAPYTFFSGEAQHISAPVMQSNLQFYKDFVAEKGGNPLTIDNFESANSNRVVVDMVLLQQALQLGGANVLLDFYGTPNPARAELYVKEGDSPLLGYETWESSFDNRVYMSSVIIEEGDFLKVIVGRLDNKHGLMKVKYVEDLQNLTAITGHRWHIDLKTLRKMGVRKVETSSVYKHQLEMLQEGRADFGMYEYASIVKAMPEGLGIVPGITVGLNESRHFMVSRSHPLGSMLFQTLQKGIAILKSRGTIQRAYRECGFYAPQLETWKRIHP